MVAPEVLGPEQQPVTRRLTVEPNPTPAFNGQNAADVAGAFAKNLDMVLGGQVTAVDGIVFDTPGVFGAAVNRIDSRLGKIEQVGADLASERGQYAVGLRGATAVRNVEASARRQTQEDNAALAAARSRVAQQQRRIRDLCQRSNITPDLQAKYDQMIKVEEYLDAHPDSADLTPIRPALEALTWTKRRQPTRERIEDLIDGALTSAQGYTAYKVLKVGQGEGDKRVPGLRDLDQAFHERDELTSQHELETRAKLEQAREKAAAWEKRNAEYRTNDNPEQRGLREERGVIKAAQAYLEGNYVPDADRLTQVGADLDQARQDLADSRQFVAGLSKFVGGRVARAAFGVVSRTTNEGLQKRIAELEAEQTILTDPVQRLTQNNAPKELVAAVKAVEGFPMGFPDEGLVKLGPKEKVLAEAVVALLDKGLVKLEETGTVAPALSEPVLPPLSTFPPRFEPLQAAPIDLATASASEIAAAINTLTAEEINQLPVDKLAKLAMTGALTDEMLRNLPSDPESRDINGQLISDDMYREVATAIERSVRSADQGQTGIQKADLPRLTLDAIRRVVEIRNSVDQLSVGSRAGYQDLRSFLNSIKYSAASTFNRTELAEADRLLTVAYTTDQLTNRR